MRLRIGALVAVLLTVLLAVVAALPAGPAAPVTRSVPETRSGPSDPRPLGVRGEWRLVWADEFDGRRLDLDRWRPNWLGGDDRAVTKPVNELELSCYDPAQVRVRGGELRLRAVRRACRDVDGRRYGYASGLVQSYADHRFTYGYAEARIHLPAGRDGSCGPNWAAFWLNGLPGPRRDEIDVMECLGRDVAWHHHWGPGRDRREESGYPHAWRGDLPGGGGWHTFGVDWAPGRLRFFYDGERVGTTRRGVSDRPHYLVLDLALDRPRVRVPQTLRVDHVRVWVRSDDATP